MATNYYSKALTSKFTGILCSGCGASMVFYHAPSALYYGL